MDCLLGPECENSVPIFTVIDFEAADYKRDSARAVASVGIVTASRFQRQVSPPSTRKRAHLCWQVKYCCRSKSDNPKSILLTENGIFGVQQD
jgi:hypothetical protein